MTRKSNRAKAKRTKTRTLAEILEEEQQQRLAVREQNGCRQRHILLERLQLDIRQHQEEVIYDHEVEVVELEPHLRIHPEIGDELLHSLRQVREFSHRRHARDVLVLRRCQGHLREIVALKELFRQATVDREERTVLREKRKQLQSQLNVLLDLILDLNQQYYHILENHLDALSHLILQYASSTNTQSEEIQVSLRTFLSDPEVRNSLERYNSNAGHCTGPEYRLSRGRVMKATNVTLSAKNDQVKHGGDHYDNTTSRTKFSLLVDFGNEEIVSVEEKNCCCIICLMEYQDGDDVYRNAIKDVSSVAKLVCNHFFHVPCISQWLLYTTVITNTTNRRTSCPCCRNPFLIQPTRNQTK